MRRRLPIRHPTAHVAPMDPPAAPNPWLPRNRPAARCAARTAAKRFRPAINRSTGDRPSQELKLLGVSEHYGADKILTPAASRVRPVGSGPRTRDEQMTNALIVKFGDQGVYLRFTGGAEGTRTPDPHTARTDVANAVDLPKA